MASPRFTIVILDTQIKQPDSDEWFIIDWSDAILPTSQTALHLGRQRGGGSVQKRCSVTDPSRVQFEGQCSMTNKNNVR